MTTEATYTIGELADRADVTPRTIRYYTAEGLLPRPDARGQYALYGEEHLLRLRLIAQLKAAYLPLGEIKARLDQLDLVQVRQLLEQRADRAEPAPAGAADYVAQVLRRQSQTIAETPARYQPAAAQAPPAMLRAAEGAPPQPPAVPPPFAAQPYGFAAPAPEQPSVAPAAAPQQAGLLSKLMPARRARSAQARQDIAQPASDEQWRRVSLAPGVELHIREPAA
ncbi:MAG TPA: MerR family transcriptional regulator, partial [Roseiflexaceae bacterium]